jgi:hypothetical protein
MLIPVIGDLVRRLSDSTVMMIVGGGSIWWGHAHYRVMAPTGNIVSMRDDEFEQLTQRPVMSWIKRRLSKCA